MTFVSYAQNYEDVMLMRAFRQVERGFYIDVGAQDPVNDSVTKAFYDLGWRGINIEPVTYWFDRLAAARRHDINLQLAVSDGPGELHLFEVVDSGLSTTDAEFAARHSSAGHQIRESDVKCVTLSEICRAHHVSEIHFLKVDCEGGEAAALRGFDFQQIRPWVLLIEATEPNSQKPAYEEWESMLLKQGYEFVYQDGLNRFYVAVERSELKGAFSYPPNVFDYFVRASEAEVRDGLQSVQAKLADLREVRDAAQAAQESVVLRASVDHLSSENERREEALLNLRSALSRADEREGQLAATWQVERNQVHADIEYLRKENERREEALRGLRSALDNAEDLHASQLLLERNQWYADTQWLRSENDRREEALARQRTALVQAERREAAVTSVLRAESEQFKGEVAQLLVGKERSETLLAELESAVGAREAELAGAKREIASLLAARSDLEGARSKNLDLEHEVGRLHFEVLIRDQEVTRLQKLAKSVFDSTSWRLTSPLRVVKRGMQNFLRLLFWCVFQIVRGPARLFRPFIRAIARWRWVRSAAIRIVGRDSPLVQHARMFLMVGVPNVEGSKGEAAAGPSKPLSGRASLILDEIYRLRGARGLDRPSSSGSE